jgi:hypothetical protein
MTPERLAALRFMAENKGHSPRTLANAGKPPFPPASYPHGSMVAITVGELREFLAHYPKENEDGSDAPTGD